MIDLVTALLRYCQEVFGTGFIASLFAIVAASWIVLKAHTTLEDVAAGMHRMAMAQEATNKIMLDQQTLCRRHAESQSSLIDNMTSLVSEVHMASVSGNRVQEQNLKNVLDLLERAMLRQDAQRPD